MQGKITHPMRNLLKFQIGANAILFLILLSVLSIKINFNFFFVWVAFGSFRSQFLETLNISNYDIKLLYLLAGFSTPNTKYDP